MNNLALWLANMGASARVVLLDSGITPYSTAKPIETRNFTTSKLEHNAEHGTDMAEIIAGRDPLSIGVAPYCHLYVAKVWSHASSWKNYERALDWALEIGAHVVSMSFAVRNLSDEFRDTLIALNRTGTICLAAWSQFSAFNGEPAVISVGRQGHQGLETGAVVSTVDQTLKKIPGGRWRAIKGASVATAIMAGVAACAKAEFPGISKDQFLTALAKG